MIKINVNKPIIYNDTIIFSWNVSSPVQFFKKNSFYIKYKDLCIKHLPLEYFWNGFLSIMIPVFKFCKEEVVFFFPTAIPSVIAELWINYHEATNIFITPLSKEEIAMISKLNIEKESVVGILFGGGKDSTYALSLLNEIYGSDKIVVLSYVLPYMDNIMEKHDKRRDTFLLNPIKNRMNIKVQKIYTNFYANLKELKYKYSTSMSIYFGTLLPALVKYKISFVCFSYEFISYLTGIYDLNKIEFHYKRTRPEYTKYVGELTSKIINSPVDIINFNYYISEIGSFKILSKRYPEMLQNLLMCENITGMKKWCLNCRKCGTYVYLSMCYGNPYFNINLNDFFEKSGYIVKLIDKINNLKSERNEDNNYPWVEEFCNSFHYESHCHVIASINIERYKSILKPKAFRNLEKIKDSYGNKKIPIHESFIEPAFKQVSPPIPKEVKDIVTKYCSPVNELPDYFKIDNSKGRINYDLRCSVPKIFHNSHELPK